MKLPTPSRRTLILGTWLAIIAIALLVLYMLWRLIALQGQTDQAATARERLDAQVVRQGQLLAVQADRITEANRRLIQAGKRPVAAPNLPPAVIQGTPGVRGPQGLPGVPGIPGLQGARGVPGAPGLPGATGATGKPGADGATGPAGPAGPAGAKGDPGPAGPAGADGTDGATGPAGPAGPQGTANPGTYLCGVLEYLRGFTIAADGSVTLTCGPLPQMPGNGKP